MSRKMLRNVEKRGVHTARNGPSPPPNPAGGPVVKPELSTADRLGSRRSRARPDGASCRRRGETSEFAVFPTAERFRSSRDFWSSGSHQCPQNSLCQFSLQRKPNQLRIFLW